MMKCDRASAGAGRDGREPEHPFPLTLLEPGRKAEIVEVACPGFGICRRLAELGLLPGVRVRVVARSGPGGMIVEREGGRMAIGRGMGHRLLVLPLEESGDAARAFAPGRNAAARNRNANPAE